MAEGAGGERVVATRLGLQQVAVHVLARRRYAVTGHFGLRPAPGGCATPVFGDDEVVRVSGATLVVERAGEVRAEALTTLGRAADLVGVDLAGEFSVGAATPAVADPGAPLAVDAAIALGLGDWWALGASLIDEVVATGSADGSVAAATMAQLWPEHFDIGSTLRLASADGPRVNVGASPGDGFEPGPYLYVGPWGDERPGDAGYWNAPFGAVLRRSHAGDRAAVLEFVRRGLGYLNP